MFGVHFRATASKTQTNWNQIKKNPIEGITFLSQMACSVILRNWVLASPEVSIQVRQAVLATAQTFGCSAKR